MSSFLNIFCFILFLINTTKIKCDYYTSVSGLELLLAVENMYMEYLEKHLQEVEEIHKELERALIEMDQNNFATPINSSSIYNSIKLFKTIRRLVVDTEELPELIKDIHKMQVFNQSAYAIALEFEHPTEDDLKGAALGFSRLQKMYKLETEQMAKGYLKGQKYSSSMSAYDCYTLGKFLYQNGAYNLASEWLLEALDRIENGNKFHKEDEEIFQVNKDHHKTFPSISMIDILEILPSSLYQSKRPQLALAMNAKLLKMAPSNTIGLKNTNEFPKTIKEDRRKRKLDSSPKISEKENLHQQVCNGDVQQTPSEKRNLRCRLVSNNVPYYFVGPLKMEELSEDPYVAQYFEVIYEKEINQTINAVLNYIERSKIGNFANSTYDEVRVSKNSWLSFDGHRFLKNVAPRLEAITGLSLKYGEFLQVANYGIGGHYGVHQDFIPVQEDFLKGNRILTALFYINDVKLGGATAFPALRLSVPPIKGSLVMWYNYHKSMEKDYRTWHAGCPVLQGSKWICNQWFSTYGQEFNRPCGLKPDHEISLPYKDCSLLDALDKYLHLLYTTRYFRNQCSPQRLSDLLFPTETFRPAVPPQRSSRLLFRHRDLHAYCPPTDTFEPTGPPQRPLGLLFHHRDFRTHCSTTDICGPTDFRFYCFPAKTFGLTVPPQRPLGLLFHNRDLRAYCSTTETFGLTVPQQRPSSPLFPRRDLRAYCTLTETFGSIVPPETPSDLLFVMRALMVISPLLVFLFCHPIGNVKGDLIATSNSNDDLLDMLHTEKVLIDGLRNYIKVQEEKLDILTRKTQEIQNLYDQIGENREGYMNNPINTVTLLKRITSDWKGMTDSAEEFLDTEELTKNITKTQELVFPTDEDYESSLVSLLRIQDMFKLEPQRLSVGEVNGIKIGSEMSWSDCLEIGLKSSKNGYHAYAKYWMETALEKIPNVGQQPSGKNASQTIEADGEEEQPDVSKNNMSEYTIKARMEVLRALLNVEYKGGNLQKALSIANEMLDINPNQKNVIKAIKQIKEDIIKSTSSLKNKAKSKEKNEKATIKKTDEELMIEEICREATHSQQMQQIHNAQLSTPTAPPCSLMTYNVKWLMLQPLKVEILSVDPFIVIYHQTLEGKKLDALKEFIVERDGDSNEVGSVQLTKLGQKKMHQINEKLHFMTGHGRESFAGQHWDMNRYNFENFMEVDAKTLASAYRQAGVLFNLQLPLLGGSVIFPQLQMNINLPQGSLLYWSTLNEFGSQDYRSKYHICPVIGGSQIMDQLTNICGSNMNVRIILNFTGNHLSFLLSVYILCVSWVSAEDGQYYASVAGLETLLKTEQILLADLKNYVEKTKESIDIFQKEILKIETEHQAAAGDTENYLTNPVNAYKLIKRLHNDWERYEEHFSKIRDNIPQWKSKSNLLQLPTQKDFEESALALVRLQKTYNLDVSQVASGILNGVKYGNAMSWSDCLLLGQQLINAKAYNQTREWIKESMRRYHVETTTAVNEYSLDFMEKLGENLIKTGNTEEALTILRALVVKDPTRLRKVSTLYDNTYILPQQYEEERDYHKTNEFKLYEKVCREEVTRSPTELRDLRCRFYRGVDNTFSLSPFKIEDLNEDPFVMVIHDIISNDQAETIKKLAEPLLERSLVRNTGGTGAGSGLVRNYRISKQAWLQYSDHRYMEKLLRDLQYATGLQTSSSEALQVANYGIGGHYEPHLDHFSTGVTAEHSNRISTSIFYLSDVEQGGATAFPYLKIAVRPTKGSVLFWYNLHRSLDGDYRTRHAGCPVLKGSKWIANVWTHDRNQDVVRPCALYRDHESSLPYETVK
ncbi:uncharacterized protein LOC142234657 [Haematobia irritans]|uniref:uncharacterized protein LOC142234657 n=1 Tax=Haematobia irritans TaxID=7368 RepID=UPI003F5076AB